MSAAPRRPVPATREAIAPFGTLIEPSEDGAPFGPADAALDLSGGTPRLYIMRLPARPLVIAAITRHARVTQCLASATGRDWFIGLAAPGAAPSAETITVFRIPGGRALALRKGCWHAGPFFEGEEADFLNLELSDTNETDHDTVRLPAPIAILP
ncbi:MAG: ureidoglycolate lyase [Roseococcus sp.]